MFDGSDSIYNPVCGGIDSSVLIGYRSEMCIRQFVVTIQREHIQQSVPMSRYIVGLS